MNSRFQSRVVISGAVHCKTGARLQTQGEGRRNPPDMYALKDLSGIPYISGANFKNFLRRQVEALLKDTLGPGFYCDSFNRDQSCIRLSEPKQDGAVYLSSLLDLYGHDEAALLQAVEKHTCLACKVFGSQLLESELHCEDLRPDSWSAQFRPKRRNPDGPQEKLEDQQVPGKFLFRIILSNFQDWKRALFLMGLSRAQNKLITLSTGRQAQQHIATIDELTVKTLESRKDYYERLSRQESLDGDEVDKEQLQAWIASLRDFLKLEAGLAIAS